MADKSSRERVRPEIFYGSSRDAHFRGEWKANGDVVVSSQGGGRYVVGNTSSRKEAEGLANEHYLGE